MRSDCWSAGDSRHCAAVVPSLQHNLSSGTFPFFRRLYTHPKQDQILFLSERVINAWNSLPVTAVDFSPLTRFKWSRSKVDFISARFNIIYLALIRCQCPSVCLSVCDGSALAHYS